MNHSLCSADRSTHSRIIVVAMSTAIVIAALATVSRVNSRIATAETVGVIKAGKLTALTRADAVAVAR